ncbi:MAG: CxxC-x17-CxxC domain-containing protein [Candidatus Omnitrophota bacterium]|jgi:CxxC-x17-CxxC domain-containing protein
MKKIVKSKSPKKRARKSAPADAELPQLVAVMAKIAERLDGLEKKTDMVLERIAFRPDEIRHVPPPFVRPEAPRQVPEPPPPVQAPQPSQPKPNRDQNGRIMYQTVCADCHQDCEVPFKPFADRPVYCKDCFAKRKSGGGGAPKPAAPPARVSEPLRPVKVFRHGGVGKVTISDMSAAPRHPVPHGRRPMSPHKKNRKPKR